MRAVAAQGIIDFPAPGVPDPSQKFQVVSSFIDKWHGHQRIYPALFAHSPYTCSPLTLKEAKALARSKGCLFFIHLAETRHEYEEIKKKTGFSPVKYLKSLDLLDEKTVCVHCVWLDHEDLETLAANRAKIVTCPQSNMKLASGIAPVKEMKDAGICIGLGTDGAASNNQLSMLREINCFSRLHWLSKTGPNLSFREIIDMATFRGAEVLGLDRNVGVVEPGKKADVILVNLGQHGHHSHRDIYDSLCHLSGKEVKTVLIDGKIIMEERKIVAFDEAEAMQNMRQLARRLSQ
jgi:5-methylthioadenosine/S-adenosylhomocysteine deaminase